MTERKVAFKSSYEQHSDSHKTERKNKFHLEKWLVFIRTWTGIGLIFLLTIQIITGYVLATKLPEFIDYKTVLFLHTQLSWVLIYFFLTHATVNLRTLFRRWWPKYWKHMVPSLFAVYLVSSLLTLYVQFFKR
jgi:hypothetical protein